MKSFSKLSALAAALLLCVSAFSQNKGYDVFIPIAKYFSQGNVESLSSWFADNLDVSILSTSGNSSRNQAKQILKSFFETYSPGHFEIVHTAGRANMKYALGSLHSGGENFLVTIFVGRKDDTFRIQQLTIEKRQ